MLAWLLAVELLYRQRSCVKSTVAVHMERSQIRCLEPWSLWTVGQPRAFKDACNGKDIVDAVEELHGLLESVQLRVPVRHIYLDSPCDWLMLFVELVS